MKRPPLGNTANPASDELVVEATISQTGSADVRGSARVDNSRDEGSRYILEGELARGGLGRVLKAHDERLGRTVALKESLAPGGVPDERFRREAAITARLQHPSIVPVYDAGTWKDGAPYYVMKLLGGGSTLKQLVAAANDLDGRLALLPHVIAVADAVAYAHSLDIIHRDLKPSNVLVGPYGETLVIDWGLAKDLARPSAEDDLPGDPYRSASPELTSVGSVIGTPQYMAPEQARGEAVDKRADVYALGAVLYYMLCGEPPYAAESSVEVLEQVRSHEPIALGARSAAIPKDLEAIVRKAMARTPGDRYASASELVDDLKRFQTGQLVRAQEYSPATLVWRWMSRHRAPLAVALVFLIASGVMALVGVRRLAHARDVADEQRAAAVAKRNELILLQARSSLEQDPTRAMAWLKTYPTDGSDWTTVQMLAARARSLGVARHLLPTGIVVQTVTSPDGKRLVTIGPSRKAVLWDIERGVELDSISTEDNPLVVNFSLDGSHVAVSGSNGVIALWDLATHQVRKLGQQNASIFNLQFSADGTQLASSGVGGPIVWNLRDGSSRPIPGHTGTVSWILFSNDGGTLFSAGEDGKLLRTKLADGSSSVIGAHQGTITRLAISDDGKLLATGGMDRTVRLWSTAGGEGRLLTTSPELIRYARFLPHSHRLATESDRIESVWDADLGLRLWQSPQQPAQIRQHEISPDGSLIALGGSHGSVQVWEWSTDRSFTLRGHSGQIMAMVFAADGTLISAGMDLETRVWTPSMRPALPRRIVQLDAAPTHVVWSPDGARVASTAGVNVRLCDAAGGDCRQLVGHAHFAYGVVFSPDGDWLLSAGGDRTARLWNVADGTSRVLQIAGGEVRRVIFAPDGRHAVLAGNDGLIYVWPTAGGEPTILRGHVGDVVDVAMSPDGRLLASGGADGTVRLWDWAQGTGRVLGSHEGTVFHLAFAPDGTALVSSARDVRLWDLAHGTSRQLVHYGDDVAALAYSPDGRLIASGSWDSSAHVWDTTTGRDRLFSGHAGRVRSLAWSRDGRQLLTGSDDQTIHVWSLDSGALDVLQGNTGSVRALAFSPKDASLAVASDDKTIRIWNALSSPMVPAEPVSLAAWMTNFTTATLH